MNERLTEIRALIDRADHAYYGGGHAIMEDEVYDALEAELRSLCPGDERLTRVGALVLAASMNAKRTHSIPMGSQDKAVTQDEFRSWIDGLGLLSAAGRLHANLKADGGSVSLEYVDGSLFQAVTRGDGFVGEEITANALKFRGLPVHGVYYAGDPFTGHVRAEIILTVDSWRTLDAELTTNPRNLGNGMSRRKDGTDAEHLQVVAFRAYSEAQVELGSTESEMEEALRSMGFPTSPSVVGDAKAVWDFYEEIKGTRSTLPYWIDGVVVKVDDLKEQRALGVANNCPRGQVAVKFPPEGKTSTLRAVVLTVGHTGAVIPTAKFDPVAIGGTSVSSALLCNWAEIAALQIAIGDTILVEKKGDIIPKIVAVTVRPAGRQAIPEPTACPVCGSDLERKTTIDGEESAAAYCVNDSCSAKVLGKLGRWLGSLNILGIGDEVLAAIVSKLRVQDAADLYTLHAREQSLANLTVSGIQFGARRAAKLIEEIEKKRILSIEDFVGSLGVEALGKRRVEIIRQAVPGEMDALDNWLDGTLLRIADRAKVPNAAARIVADLERTRPLVERLIAAGVSVREEAASGGPRGGAPSVCITGALSKPKGHYESLVREKGWAWKDGVSRELTYLVMADPASSSSKAVKARQLGTKIISEQELLDLLR